MRVMKTLTFDLAGLGWTGQVAPPRKLFLNWTIVLLKNDVFLLLVSKRSSNEPMKTTSRYGLGYMLLKLLSFVTRHMCLLYGYYTKYCIPRKNHTIWRPVYERE